jgi:hypothetical protein
MGFFASAGMKIAGCGVPPYPASVCYYRIQRL